MMNNIIPVIGLGTWKLVGEECETVVQQALELGYRHIDTADAYQNHEAVGRAMRPWPRKDIFLTSKLWLNELEPRRVDESVPRFLKELKVEYLDLLLIHWPNPKVNLVETLKAMLALKEKGLTRHIGVSNFVRQHLEMLVPYKFPILTNQIELHPYFQRNLLAKTCKNLGIHITAYRPLAKGAFEQDQKLQKIGLKYQKTPSQIVLKWLIQQGMSAIPKAATYQHLKDNIEIFDFTLSDEDMKEIDNIDTNKRFCAPEGFPVYED